MKVIHDYEDMPPNYMNLYFAIRFENGKELNKIVKKFIKSLEKKADKSKSKEELHELELYNALLSYKYNDEDIHPDFNNFFKYFRKTKKTTNTETRKKINLLLLNKDFIHAHTKEEVKLWKEVISSLGVTVMDEIKDLARAEENRIKNYQQGATKRKKIGKEINSKLLEISPPIIKEAQTKDNFFSKIKFRKNNIGFFVKPDIGKDREIVTEYMQKAKKSLQVSIEDLDDENDNFFVTFTSPDDQMFMRSILNRSFMKEPLEGIKIRGISLPVIIQHCQFKGLSICEPERHELEFNEYYESIKRGIFSFNNRTQIKTYSEESIRYVIEQLMLDTGIESELHLACYLHFNFLLPLQKYVDKREVYFEKNNIIMRAEDFKEKRESIYQSLILEGKANIKWKNEAELYKLVVQAYPDAIYQYVSEWLGRQSLDIYIPSLKIGIEYQGRQHYEAIDFFGGEEAFQYRLKLDSIKVEKCIANGVELIHWNYKEVVNKTNLNKKIIQLKQ